MSEVVLTGMDDLVESIDNLIKKYPDRAGDFLTKQARETRKGVVKEAKSAVDIDSTNRYSLGKIGNYKISPVQGYGSEQYVDLSAKSPHFHLIENGHNLVSHSGKSIGWVPGYQIMDAETRRRKARIHIDLEALAEELLKEEGFL